MIEEALRYQTKGENWVKRVGIGGGLLGVATFFSFLVFPIAALFPVYGYLLEVIRAGLRGETETPPSWGDYDLTQLSINGLKVFGIVFVFGFAINIIAWVPSAVLSVIGGALNSGAIALLGTLVWGLLYLLGTLAVAVIAPVALSNFIVKGELGAAFDVDVLKNIVPEMAMLRAAGIGIVIYLIALVASSVISIFIITILLVPFILFVGISGMGLVWGQGFAEAYETVYGELPTIPDGPLDASAAATAGAAGSAAASETTSDTTSTTPDDPANAASDDGQTTPDTDESTASDDSEKKDGYWDN